MLKSVWPFVRDRRNFKGCGKVRCSVFTSRWVHSADSAVARCPSFRLSVRPFQRNTQRHEASRGLSATAEFVRHVIKYFAHVVFFLDQEICVPLVLICKRSVATQIIDRRALYATFWPVYCLRDPRIHNRRHKVTGAITALITWYFAVYLRINIHLHVCSFSARCRQRGASSLLSGRSARPILRTIRCQHKPHYVAYVCTRLPIIRAFVCMTSQRGAELDLIGRNYITVDRQFCGNNWIV